MLPQSKTLNILHFLVTKEVKNQSCSCNYKKFGTQGANRLETQDGGIIVPNSSMQRTVLKSQDIVAFLKHKVGANLILGWGLPLRSLHFGLLTFLKEEICRESPLSNIGYAEVTEKCDHI